MLKMITENFLSRTGWRPLVGAEVEFYLPADFAPETAAQRLLEAGIETYGVEAERGQRQFEIALKKPDAPEVIAQQIATIRKLLPEADFRAKPFADRPGSGLHIHISLVNEKGESAFAKPPGEEEESPLMQQAIAGLLAHMHEGFLIFAPHEESYARFTAAFNPQDPLEGRYNNAPVNASWGGNNRTTALRIPASSAWAPGRHIEHRVAGSDAEEAKVIGAILLAMAAGIEGKMVPPPKIWGNATDPQYADLPAFPKTLAAAQEIYNKSGIYAPLDR